MQFPLLYLPLHPCHVVHWGLLDAKAALLLPSSSWQARENIIRGSWVEIKTGRDLLLGCPPWAKQTWLGKLFYYWSNQIKARILNQILKKQILKKPFAPLLPSFQARLLGNGGWGQFITCHLCCSFLLRGRTPLSLPLLLHGIPPTWDRSSLTFSTWVLPTSCSSSRAASAWVPSTECSPSEIDCSSSLVSSKLSFKVLFDRPECL